MTRLQFFLGIIRLLMWPGAFVFGAASWLAVAWVVRIILG